VLHPVRSLCGGLLIGFGIETSYTPTDSTFNFTDSDLAEIH